MENRVGKSHGVGIPEKSRSLDLKSLYETKNSKWDQNSNNSKRKGGGLKDSRTGLIQRLADSNRFCGASLPLEDGAIKIPRRKRGLVGRRKVDNGSEGGKLARGFGREAGNADQADKLAGEDEVGDVDQSSKLAGEDKGKQVELSKAKQKKDSDDLKDNRNGDLDENVHLKEEDGHDGHSVATKRYSSLKKSDSAPLVVNNGDSSLQKSLRKRSRKKKDMVSDMKRTKEADPSVDTSIKISDVLHDEDEENLEENAAMIYVSGSESSSVDTDGRVLRPRKQNKEKGSMRKRRHYYEIFFGDLDAHWVLNRRIKVFWPLDQSWYHGLVGDYDEDRKLHHVKYDDRDEEWINLQNERFKLLLLPGEVSEDDSYEGAYMDSEPIISWLARSTHRVKSSPLCSLKKQKISYMSSTRTPLSSLNRDRGKLCSNSVSSDSVATDGRSGLPVMEKPVYSKGSKLPIVYYRKRFRETSNVLCHESKGIHISARSLVPRTVNFGALEEHDTSLGRLDSDEDLDGLDAFETLWSADNAGLLRLNISATEPRFFRFKLSFQLPSVPCHYLFGSEIVSVDPCRGTASVWQLPLSECTFDKVKALQCGMNHLHSPWACCDATLNKVSHRRSRQSIGLTGVLQRIYC
ncbi:hypothetical protein OIU78_001969 [Salix suchowensis]|nr:hypothetical protein OIU78_001969 [Salix suchowensis]